MQTVESEGAAARTMQPYLQNASARNRRTIPDLVRRYTNVPIQVCNPEPVRDPLVSVIVSTFNHEAYITQCLDGILAQSTRFPIEILIGEDDSDDRTRETCRRYLEKHPDRISLILNDRRNNIKIDGKPSGRFNFICLLAAARGKYIAICEGDDYWVDVRQIEKLTQALERDTNCALAFTNARMESDSGIAGGPELKRRFCRDLSRQDLALGARVPTRASLFRNVFKHSVIPDNFLAIANADTYIFSFLGKFGGGRFVANIEPPVYRIHGAGIWSGRTSVERRLTGIRTLRAIGELHAESEYAGIIRGRLLYESLGFALIELGHFRFGPMLAHAREAATMVRSRPLSVLQLSKYLAIRFLRRS
ncbi:MAG: glycosyltransferase [Methylococcaceae bacterium]|nr:glycosyltransferase [Methylococcaceae bacterium]MCI0732554.1 glycosyltransferase [Methylococcaceae bacterium]